MRGIRIGSVEAVLKKDGDWDCSDPRLERILDQIAKDTLEEVTPADGNPLAVILQRVVELLKPSEVVDTTPSPRKVSEEIIY